MNPEYARWLTLGTASLGAGFINAVAGGGTLLTFSALWVFLPSVTANATSTVALLPGAVSSAWGFRCELRTVGPNLAWLALPSILGGATGAFLLTRLDPKIFAHAVPWLVAGAALLLLAQPAISRYLKANPNSTANPPTRWLAVAVAQYLIGIYGGYFGAGVGILLLGALSFLPFANFHQTNAVKTILNFCINCTAAILFILHQRVSWRYAALMALMAMIGGYSGAALSRRVEPQRVRQLVTTFGLLLAAYYFCR